MNHTGDQVLARALPALTTLTQELQNGTPESIQSTGGLPTGADQEVLAAQSDVGSRLLQIREAGEQLSHREVDFADRRDALRDADPTEAMVRVVAAQSALERAYVVIGKVLSTSLVDYLR